jgi:cytochrome c biogenesis protein
MDKDKEKTIVDKAWDLMASVKLAVVLFALIALTSIVGTIIEQNADPAKNLQVIGSLFGQERAPALYKLFASLGFMDMYRSWWFTTFLMLFAANLIICSLDRLPRIWKLVKDPIKPMSKEHLQAIPVKRDAKVSGTPESVKDKVLEAAKKVGIKFAESVEGEDVQLYGEKGRLSRLGVYVTHLSIIVILLGAVVGIYMGFKGYIEIPEGATYTVAFRSVGMLSPDQSAEQRAIIDALQDARGSVSVAAANLGVTASRLRNRARALGILPLDFGVRLDDFEVEFYESPGRKTDMPKEYASSLVVVDGGNEVIKKRIEVNDPLRYKGITFYQSSYGLTQSGRLTYLLRVTSRTGSSNVITVGTGEKFTIPGTSIEGQVSEFNPALAFDPSGRPFTYAQLMNNPAVRVTINDGSSEYAKWILRRVPNSWRLMTGDVIELRDVYGAQKTGLQVRKDPGVWIVYLGCILMACGLYMAFFTSHRKMWIVLTPSKGATSVTVAASANKSREAFERKLDRMISLLREGGK